MWQKKVRILNVDLLAVYYGVEGAIYFKVPAHSIFSKARKRFGQKLFLEVFRNVYNFVLGTRCGNQSNSRLGCTLMN